MQTTATTTPQSTTAKNKNHDRFSGKAFHAVLRYSRTRGNHRLFLTTLAGKWASDEGLAWPAHSSIAEAMNCSVRLVGDLQRELVEMGELEITGTSPLGTNILRMVCVREGESFRPKKVSQKAEPKPRRKSKRPPVVQVQHSAAAKSADKEPENFSSPNTIPVPSASEEPVKKTMGQKPVRLEEAPDLRDPAVPTLISKTVLKTGTTDGRAPLTPEERALAEKWFFNAVPRGQWKLGLPITKQQSAQLQSAMRNRLIPWPQPGSKLAVMMARAR